MLKDRDGLWWIGSYQGFYLLDTASGILHDYTSQAGIPKSTIITVLFRIRPALSGLLHGDDCCFKKKENQKNVLLQHTVFKSPDIQSVVMCMYIDHENRMWIGTHSDGIFMFDHATKKFIPYPYNDLKTGSN